MQEVSGTSSQGTKENRLGPVSGQASATRPEEGRHLMNIIASRLSTVITALMSVTMRLLSRIRFAGFNVPILWMAVLRFDIRAGKPSRAYRT